MQPVLALLALHVLCAAFWVGGMATIHAAVRPAVAEVLTEAPLRLRLMAAVLKRFFAAVAAAIGLLWVSGLALIVLSGGMGAQSPRVHVMLGIGLLMTALFGHIRFAAYPRLRRAVEAATWPAAGAALNGIRQTVLVNLVLGVLVFVVALVGRTA